MTTSSHAKLPLRSLDVAQTQLRPATAAPIAAKRARHTRGIVGSLRPHLSFGMGHCLNSTMWRQSHICVNRRLQPLGCVVGVVALYQPVGETSSVKRGAYWSKNTRATSSRRLRTSALSKIDLRWSCTV